MATLHRRQMELYLLLRYSLLQAHLLAQVCGLCESRLKIVKCVIIEAAAIKPASQKLKVVVRRLAPSLTETEFTTVIGDDWKIGRGKVDWFKYKPGKDSRE